jgi:hypothetical protein
MVRVLALVEGPTERNFGQKLIASHLGMLGIEFHPRVIGKPGHKGGVGLWDRAKKELVALIRQEPSSVCTTMFDLYALPTTWPGRAEAIEKGLRNAEAVAFIEQQITRAIEADLQDAGFSPQFVAYLSLHEFEALLFSDPLALAGVTQGADHAHQFQAILAECGECERIDDHPESAPSKRILKVAPGYDKTVDGLTAATRIGLPVMRERCPHFDTWLKKLESFGSAGQ